jgi:hypothetical protein
MMTIEQIAEEYRVPVKRDDCGDKIIRGRNGHLYVDEGEIFVCYTDDGREARWAPFTPKKKGNAIRKLGTGIARMKQEGDVEFIAEISAAAVPLALRILHVRRFMVTKGVSRNTEHLRKSSHPQSQGAFPPLESIADGRVMVSGGPVPAMQ